MEILSIILGILLVVFLSIKGMNIIIPVLISMFIISIFGNVAFFNLIFGENSIVFYIGEFVEKYIFIFLFGSIMASYMESSGALDTIAMFFEKLFRKPTSFKGLLVVYLFTSFLTLGGISLFVVIFAAVPLARKIFEKYNIEWEYVLLALFLGFSTFTAGIFPGSPSIINVVAADYLGTSLMASPIHSFISSVLSTISAIFSMWIVTRSIEKNIIYTKNIDTKDMKRPNLFLSSLPIFILILMIYVGSYYKVDLLLQKALLIVIIIEIIIYNKYVDNHIRVLNTGVINSYMPLLSTAITTAFGKVIAGLKSVEIIIIKLGRSLSNPFIFIGLITIIFSIISASASGTVDIIADTQSNFIKESNINIDIMHRFITTASLIFVNAPHSGVVISTLNLTKLDYKKGYVKMYIWSILVGIVPLTYLFIVSIFA